MSTDKCCKGHTYKCDKCRRKFCERCQNSTYYDGQELCYDCYLKTRGRDAESDSERDRAKDRKIQDLEEQLGQANEKSREEYYSGRESAFREALEYLNRPEALLDKAKIVQDLEKCILDAKMESCCIQ